MEEYLDSARIECNICLQNHELDQLVLMCSNCMKIVRPQTDQEVLSLIENEFVKITEENDTILGENTTYEIFEGFKDRIISILSK